ncbi:MAG: AhpC/TSA family protein [Bacteroidaceae bacterium]|nr:AhpC/TSA family protein [Bacteroidaceae bacterium]
MKKISLLALAALSFAACQNNSYRIDGTTDDSMEGATAYLIDSNTNEAIDSCVVTKKAFTFAGEIQKPQICRAQIGRRSNIVLTEPGSEIIIDFTATGPTQQAVTDNNGANNAKNEFIQSLNEFMSGKQEIYEQMIKEEEAQEKIMAFSNSAQKEMNELYKKCISDNKDNIFGAFMLANIAQNLYGDIATLDSVISAVKYAADIKQLQDVRKAMSYKEATKEGKPFVDFKGKGVDGKEVSLSDFVGKGKYVLIDFWASWCGPCRGEIPNLIAVNKEFGGDTFEVLGVNVWDQEQKFHESIKNEGMDYEQIFVPNEVNATELYGINGIPQIMLIGPDGTIIKRNLRGSAIKEAVKTALGK